MLYCLYLTHKFIKHNASTKSVKMDISKSHNLKKKSVRYGLLLNIIWFSHSVAAVTFPLHVLPEAQKFKIQKYCVRWLVPAPWSTVVACSCWKYSAGELTQRGVPWWPPPVEKKTVVQVPRWLDSVERSRGKTAVTGSRPARWRDGRFPYKNYREVPW